MLGRNAFYFALSIVTVFVSFALGSPPLVMALALALSLSMVHFRFFSAELGGTAMEKAYSLGLSLLGLVSFVAALQGAYWGLQVVDAMVASVFSILLFGILARVFVKPSR